MFHRTLKSLIIQFFIFLITNIFNNYVNTLSVVNDIITHTSILDD